ncbi:MAG: GH92 family glycosyl hydrolase, partial [Flavobacteriia bacterium]
MRVLLMMLLSSNLLIGQDNSIQQIQQSQSVRKQYIDKSIGNKNFHSTSKSLFVDPFIGTGGHGHTYPGASAPFGMIQLSPDTRHDGWDGCSGYHFSDSVIYGFSHTHLSGVGVPDYCDLLIVPQSGKARTTPGYIDKTNGFGSRFSHLEEKAAPGYYEVKLKDENINVRLTTSERAGIHEYTFLNKEDKKYILIDLDHRDQLLDQSIDFQSDKKTISGYRISNAWATNQHFYFYLNLSAPFVKAKRIEKNGQHKLLLTFSASTEKLLIRVGISAVDIEGAKMNVNKEIPDFDFNAVRSSVSRKWNEELGKIDFQSTDKSVMTNFYTALYHTFLQPNLFSDIDGRYRGRDNAIHLITDNIPQYTVFSLWDTYRGTHPLYTIVQQKRTNEFIETFLRQFEQGKDLPVWELAGNETECMIGYHSVSVIADAYVKGLRDFNAKFALEAMKTTSQIDELGKTQFHENGFISSGDEPESVSKTLEYAYDDFCIATMAKSLNQDIDFQKYSKSAFNFLNLYDPSSKFMRARRGGLWYSPFEPSEVNFNYTEANSWQYSLYAPHA